MLLTCAVVCSSTWLHVVASHSLSYFSFSFNTKHEMLRFFFVRMAVRDIHKLLNEEGSDIVDRIKQLTAHQKFVLCSVQRLKQSRSSSRSTTSFSLSQVFSGFSFLLRS